jgi:hypothetical protein
VSAIWIPIAVVAAFCVIAIAIGAVFNAALNQLVPFDPEHRGHRAPITPIVDPVGSPSENQ